MDYTSSAAKSNKKDIADLWVEQLGDARRNRVSTVEMVDAGFGLGMQAVSRANPVNWAVSAAGVASGGARG